HVRVCPVGPAAKFRRHNVRAQKSRGDIERLQLEQLAVQSEDFQLTRSIEAIAAFGLEGSGAVRGEIFEGSKRSLLDRGRARGAAQQRQRLRRESARPRRG